MEEVYEEHYKISADRLNAIVRLSGVDLPRARAICTYPWPDPAMHQQWLDEAPAAEIAHWVRFIADLEDQDKR